MSIFRAAVAAISVCVCTQALFAHPSHQHQSRKVQPEDELRVLRQQLTQFQRTGQPTALSQAQVLARKLTADDIQRPEALYLAARTAQAAHDFPRAKKLLQQLRAFAPRDQAAAALLASIHTVQGQTHKALRACAAVFGLQGMGCRLRARLAAGNPPGKAELDSFEALVIALEHQHHPSTTGWLWATLGDAAIATGALAQAANYYQKAHDHDPLVRYRSGWADTLLATGRPAAALDVIGTNPMALGLRVKQAIAQKRLQRLDRSSANFKALAGEIAQLQASNDLDHAREIAEFLLDVEHQPDAAAHFASAGLQHQREAEDVALAIRAALRSNANYPKHTPTKGAESGE